MATSNDNGNARHYGKHAAPSGSQSTARRSGGSKPAGKRFRDPSTPQPTSGSAPSSQPSAGQASPRISSDAPRPVHDTSAFQTISSGEGAVLHDRDSASEAAHAARSNYRSGSGQRISADLRPQVKSRQGRAKLGRPVMIALAAVAVVLVAVIVVFAVVLNEPSTSLETDDTTPTRDEQVQADDQAKGISYDGYTYACAKDDDGATYSFVRYASGSTEPMVLFQFQGTPVTEVLYNGAFVIPQNLGDSWNVVAWHIGDGSEPTQLTQADGSAVQGSGSISSASLDGSNLLLNFDTGDTMTVPLG